LPRPGEPAHGHYNRPPSSGCGGTGRRARLRALWTFGSVEVRILSAAFEQASIWNARNGTARVSGRRLRSEPRIGRRHPSSQVVHVAHTGELIPDSGVLHRYRLEVGLAVRMD